MNIEKDKIPVKVIVYTHDQTHKQKSFVYHLVQFKKDDTKDKKYLMRDQLNEFLPRFAHYELFNAREKKIGEPNKPIAKIKSKLQLKVEKLDKDVHVKIANTLNKIQSNNGKGFTIKKVDEWNKWLNFDLHSEIDKYGASGCNKLCSIFRLS